MAADPRLELFAACLPGVEPFLAREMTELNLIKPDRENPASLYRTGEGGIAFTGSPADLYRANLWLRTANRVLLRLGNFHAVKFVELRRKAGNLPWEKFLVPGQPVAMRTTCRRSKLYHSGGVSERVINAMADRLGRAPEVREYQENAPSPQLVLVRFEDDYCTISLDTSGEGLHRRGYRQAVAKAPLRETLAAAILIASGWDKQAPLLDPFCGSGVIPIEAALLASRIAPGLNRRFSFMDWPGFSRVIFKNETAMAVSETVTIDTVILGSDRDAGAVKAARENAERAGIARLIQFSQAAISDIQPPIGPGWVVTNPPYGVRIGGSGDLRDLFTQFGKVLKARCPGWQAAFLCINDRLASLTRLNFEKGVSLNNGGIPVKLSIGTVPTD